MFWRKVFFNYISLINAISLLCEAHANMFLFLGKPKEGIIGCFVWHTLYMFFCSLFPRTIKERSIKRFMEINIIFKSKLARVENHRRDGQRWNWCRCHIMTSHSELWRHWIEMTLGVLYLLDIIFLTAQLDIGLVFNIQYFSCL